MSEVFQKLIDRTRAPLDPAWHLHAALPLAEVAARLGHTKGDCAVLITDARARLFALREARVRLGRDAKVLTSGTFGHRRHGLRGEGVRRTALGGAGAPRARLRSRCVVAQRTLAGHLQDGLAHLNAGLDDHAFLLGVLLELMPLSAGRALDSMPDDSADLPEVLAKPLGAHRQAWVCRGPKWLPRS